MKKESFYRRSPSDALAGMVGMTLEERGVYNTVIDLLYLTWRPLEDNRAYLAAHCGCAVQKLNPLINSLIAKHKLLRFEEGGVSYLSNRRFEDERTEVKGATPTRSGRGKVREKSGEVGEKSASVGENPPRCADEPKEKQPVTPLDRLEKTRPDRNTVSNETDAEASDDDDWLAELRAMPIATGAWRLGLKVLVDQGGLTDTKARNFLGKLKAGGLEPGEMWQIAEAAAENGTPDPIPYLSKAAEQAIQRRASAAAPWNTGILDPDEARQRFWMQDFIDNPAQWRPGDRGPEPGRPRCRISPAIQREFGVEPAAEERAA